LSTYSDSKKDIRLGFASDGETAFSHSVNVRGNQEFANSQTRCIMGGDHVGVAHVVFPSDYFRYVSFGLEHQSKNVTG